MSRDIFGCYILRGGSRAWGDLEHQGHGLGTPLQGVPEGGPCLLHPVITGLGTKQVHTAESPAPHAQVTVKTSREREDLPVL